MKTTATKKHIPLLLYPPLIEAIFELHWELVQDQKTGHLIDPSYPVMYGRMYQKLKDDFPELEDLPSTQVHPGTSPYVVRHRMRREKNGYPLIQIGPGIMTVNGAKGYSWRSFQSSISRAIKALLDFYPENIDPIRFLRCELRFINGVPVDPQNQNPLAFLEEKLHTKIEMDPDFFALYEMTPHPHAVNLNLSYPLSKPQGNLVLSTQLGKMETREAYIFQILIQSAEKTIPHALEAFEFWLAEAHGVAEHSFSTFCKGFLMEKFCGL